MDEAVLFEQPLLYCHFAQGIGDPKYMPVTNWPDLTKSLNEALENHNEINAAMNLVLFEDAIQHILRINRILESPRGNALLVGVGGSGKQSLSRLAAFISSLEVYQITLRKGYGIPDLKVDLSGLYIKAGLKNIGTVFLMTDAQVADEKFLVLVNDLLASGEIPDLFPDDEVENIINGVRNEVKGIGLQDTRENCWKFFIDRVRRMLKVVLCFSPVGSTLRVRGRKFPAVVTSTSIDWFHEWPEEALVSVSHRFLQEVELLTVSSHALKPTFKLSLYTCILCLYQVKYGNLSFNGHLPHSFCKHLMLSCRKPVISGLLLCLQPDMQESVAQFMAQVHKSVNEMSTAYLTNERRYNYTTPKSFLEQIKLYQNLLNAKHTELQAKMMRLENGLEKLKSTAQQVGGLI